MTKTIYQFGGSLRLNSPTYVVREADMELYEALIAGEFCYILNCRQIGKSSLLVRTLKRLQAEGYKCTTIDMTLLGSENTTPLQWYKGIVAELWRGFDLLREVNLKVWWAEKEDISFIQRLSYFIEYILLARFSQEQIVIFIDEIDTILGLDFSVDDFFALIRFCYNQRAINPEYNRLTFAIFGVATPRDLINDNNRTPFNIGKAIEIREFKLEEVEPLLTGLEKLVSNSEVILKEIMNWSYGQPFLTQKLCHLVQLNSYTTVDKFINLPENTESFWVKNLVYSNIIENWENQDEPEHLKTIADRLTRNEERAGRLLGIYQQILHGVKIPLDHSEEQIELLLSGLVKKNRGYLEVKNCIYIEVFNLKWIEKKLEKLRPYSQTFDGWIASKQTDKSRLLRGKALKDARAWAQGKSLSDLDYKFLDASSELDNREIQLTLEAERTKEIEARLIAEQKASKQQKILLFVVSTAFLLACGLGMTTYVQYRRALSSERIARVSEVQALISSSQGLFASRYRLDALVEAIKATRRLQTLKKVDKKIQRQATNTLRQAVYQTNEYNRLSGHQGAILTVDISPDSSLIASGSVDNTIKLWQHDGTEIATLTGHTAAVRSVKFSKDGKLIATGSDDGTVKLWQRDGSLLKTFKGHSGGIWEVDFSPDSKVIVSASFDRTAKLWRQDGSWLTTLTGHAGEIWGVAFSPVDDVIATASLDGTVKLWKQNGTLLTTLRGHTAAALGVSFSPDGKFIASTGEDQTIRLWNRQGKFLRTFEGHSAATMGIAFSPDGQTIVSSSADKTLKLWRVDGTELTTLRGNSSAVWGVAWSPDGKFIASAGTDNVVKLWQSQNPFQTIINAEDSVIWGVDITDDGQTIATASRERTAKLWNRQGKLLDTIAKDGTRNSAISMSSDGKYVVSITADQSLQLWQRDGKILTTFLGHQGLVMTVAFSPDDQIIASGAEDNTVKLWRRDGTLLQTLRGHEATVWKVAFSPDGKTIASASGDGTIKLWQLDGTLLRTFEGHQGSVWRVAFSPNGKYLASGSADNTVKLWQVDGTLLNTFAGHQAAIWGLAFSPDSEIIASGSVDTTLKLWHRDGKELTTFRGHTGAIRELVYSPDGEIIASVSEDNTLILWNVERSLNIDILEYGCSLVRDYLRTNKMLGESDRSLCESE